MNPAFERRLRLSTAEGVEFSYLLAGPVARALAIAIDLGIVTTLTSMANGLLATFRIISPDLATFFSILTGFLLSIGYGIFMESRRRGRTIGKKIFGLRVIDVDGRRLETHQVVLRNLLRVVDQLPLFYLVGGISALANRRGQRLGDLLAGTVVICERDTKVTTPAAAESERYNSLRNYPALAKRLRQALSPVEFQVACAALARREQLTPEARLTLYAEIAAHLKTLAQFPPEALEGLADERFIRNVVEIVQG